MRKTDYIAILHGCSSTLRNDYGIKSLRLFCSKARGEDHEGSDVDVFVDTETPNPFLLMDAKDFLERLVGRSVDIIRNHKNKDVAAGTVLKASLPFLKSDECEKVKGQLSYIVQYMKEERQQNQSRGLHM